MTDKTEKLSQRAAQSHRLRSSFVGHVLKILPLIQINHTKHTNKPHGFVMTAGEGADSLMWEATF